MGTKETNDQQPLSEVVVNGETRKDQQPNITTAESDPVTDETISQSNSGVSKEERKQKNPDLYKDALSLQGSYRADTFDLFKDALSLDR